MDNNKVSTWPEIYPEIVSLLEGRTIRAFRVDFDSYMIKNSCRAFNLDTAWMETCQWEDMKLFLNSATRIGRELAGELVAKYKKATDEPAQIIPFPAHRWQQFAMME
ncbi:MULTISPECIES: 3'-5' exonuclease family protein [Acetobacter]|uniref:Uncharacterized protein n=1 Tax=Acetobacter lovaniensis TaxID=104100 RepID=A0A841QJS7_9PROT|nr:hypothetical protein [Acetobacter lovaniensis]MBB6458666.1 hypothetical protein [Acetobacter lovaniensis]MCP1240953.1 hypothetical protein [Acetobacter lovaniensis]